MSEHNMPFWLSRCPFSCRHWVDHALTKRMEERRKYPNLPFESNRFRLDFTVNPNTHEICLFGQPFSNAVRLFSSYCSDPSLPKEDDQHKPTMAIMIRQENDKIFRMIRSMKPYISSFLILDTGSTDETIHRMLMFLSDIPGTVYYMPFVDFGTNRTALVHLCYQHNHHVDRSQLSFVSDWILLVDADYVLTVDLQKYTPAVSWTEQLKQWKHVNDIEMKTVENLEYWRVHIPNTKKKKKAYICRTHEYITDDHQQAPHVFIGYNIPQRLQGVAINHIGDGRFGAKSSKHSRDIILLMMDAIDGFDLIRSFEYLCRTAYLHQDFVLANWCGYELFRLPNVSRDTLYTITQEFSKSVYAIHHLSHKSPDNANSRDCFGEAIATILHGLSVNPYRLETLAELMVHLSHQHEYGITVSMGTLFLFNSRDPAKDHHQSLFVDHHLHEFTFERYMCFAGYYIPNYQLMSLYIYYEHLEKQTWWKSNVMGERSSNHKLFESRFHEWNDNVNHVWIKMIDPIRTKLSVLASSVMNTSVDQAYQWLTLSISTLVKRSDLPYDVHVWLNQHPELESDLCFSPGELRDKLLSKSEMKHHPLYGYENGKKINTQSSSSSSVLMSTLCMKLFLCSKHIQPTVSLWQQLSYLIDAYKYWPDNRQVFREMIQLTRSESWVVRRAMMEIQRLLIESIELESKHKTQLRDLSKEESSMLNKLKSIRNEQEYNFQRIRKSQKPSLGISVTWDHSLLVSDMYHAMIQHTGMNQESDTVEASGKWYRLHQFLLDEPLPSSELTRYGSAYVFVHTVLFEMDPLFTRDQLYQDCLNRYQRKGISESKYHNNFVSPADIGRTIVDKKEQQYHQNDVLSRGEVGSISVSKEQSTSMAVRVGAMDSDVSTGQTNGSSEGHPKDGNIEISEFTLDTLGSFLDVPAMWSALRAGKFQRVDRISNKSDMETKTIDPDQTSKTNENDRKRMERSTKRSEQPSKLVVRDPLLRLLSFTSQTTF